MEIMGVLLSAVGAYNIIKGAWSMYSDAQSIRDRYQEYRHLSYKYRREQNVLSSPMSESQCVRTIDEFYILDDSPIEGSSGPTTVKCATIPVAAAAGGRTGTGTGKSKSVGWSGSKSCAGI